MADREAPAMKHDDDKRLERLEQQLADIRTILKRLHETSTHIMSDLSAITDAVARQETVQESIVELLNGIAQQLRDAVADGADPAAVQAIADQIDADTARLSDAVTANTESA